MLAFCYYSYGNVEIVYRSAKISYNEKITNRWIMDFDTTIFGEKIKNLRISRGLSQFELSELIGVHEKQISRIETGVNTPSFETAMKLIYALNMNPSILARNQMEQYNPLKDDIISLLDGADEQELLLYREMIKTLQHNLRLSFNERRAIKEDIDNRKQILIERAQNSERRKIARRKVAP